VVIKNIDDLVPESLEIALIEAMRVNPDLKVFKSDSLIAKSEVIRVRRSEWAPKLSFVAKYVDEHNPSGSTFDKEEANFGVRFTWNFNTGLRASKAEAVARHNSLSADEELQNSKSGISESTKNAWAELESAKKRSKYLGNQASILEQFLELARKERELGKRSLLDVLTAETSLVNAKSDKMIADSEVLKAQLNLLLQISKLDISILR
jgi:adhesin transport system outer membrane protein